MSDENSQDDLIEGGHAGAVCSAPAHVANANELTVLIERLALASDDDSDSHAPGVHDLTRLQFLLDEYLERPTLLDEHIVAFITPIVKGLRSEGPLATPPASSTMPAQQQTESRSARNASQTRRFKVLYHFSKVRGAANVAQLLPHEVSDFEPVLRLLTAQTAHDSGTWEERYVALLWASVVARVPFALERVAARQDESESVAEMLVRLARPCVGEPGAVSDVASLLLARVLLRPDVDATLAEDVFEWCRRTMRYQTPETAETSMYRSYYVLGAIHVVALAFKLADRQSRALATAPIDEFVTLVGSLVGEARGTVGSSQRKQGMKLIQRIGVHFLPVRRNLWRYRVGRRSLLHNLSDAIAKVVHDAPEAEESLVFGLADKDKDDGAASNRKVEEEEEEEEEKEEGERDEEDDDGGDVPESVEAVLDTLLTGLRDKDTTVRWTAAKGVGRVTERLPSDMADDVVGEVIGFFTEREGDAGWHGACLALAELARRGLLVPDRLVSVVPLVVKALDYEVRRGTHSIGSHVRDAACFVAWAFSRAYDPAILHPYVAQLARSLAVVSVFDREINCRRAASAAFQEHVGRQGEFPNGIEIVQVANFFTVGNRLDSYLKVAPQIAQFEEYRIPLVDYLVDCKVTHWDRSLRELSAKALGALVPSAHEYIFANVLPKLVNLSTSSDVATRHGATLAVAEIVLAAHECGHVQLDSHAKLCDRVVQIVPQIEAQRLYRGRGGEMVRNAACRLIECISRASLSLDAPPPSQSASARGGAAGRSARGMARGRGGRGGVGARKPLPTKTILRQSLDEQIQHPTETIQDIAADAMEAFYSSYYDGCAANVTTKIVDIFIRGAESESLASRRGYCVALGRLAPEMIHQERERILNTLCKSARGDDAMARKEAEVRRNAVVGLTRIVERLSFEKDSPVSLSESDAARLADVFELCLGDYSTDNRGDVGSWVRENALLGIDRLVVELTRAECEGAISDETRRRATELLFVGALRLNSEHIDRLRNVSGTIMFRALWNEHVRPYIANVERLSLVYPVDSVIDFSMSAQTVPRLVSLLDCDNESQWQSICVGLVTSSGGITKALVRVGLDTLAEWFASRDEETSNESRLARAAVLDFIVSLTSSETPVSERRRLFVPAVRVLSHIHSVNAAADILVFADGSNVVEKTCRAIVEVVRSRDISRITACVHLAYALLGVPALRDDGRVACFNLVVELLTHEFPTIRKLCCDEVFARLLTNEELLPPDSSARLQTLLLSTEWDAALESEDLARLRAELEVVLV